MQLKTDTLQVTGLYTFLKLLSVYAEKEADKVNTQPKRDIKYACVLEDTIPGYCFISNGMVCRECG